MADVVVVTVRGELTLNGLVATARAVCIGVATLDHKVLDNSVEGKTVVEATLNERDEVCNGDGCGGRIKEDNESTKALNTHLNVLNISAGYVTGLKIFACAGTHFLSFVTRSETCKTTCYKHKRKY